MQSAIEICEGATISAGEVERVKQAMAELDKDPHAPREITLTATLHIHREYPKTLYKGTETRSVADAKQQAAAEKDGFGPYDHEAYTVTSEPSAPLIVTGTVDRTIQPGDKFSVASVNAVNPQTRTKEE